jgi:predicted HAD superfamily phosphohydrolase YqeG
MSEKEISYLVDSKLIEINHKLSKKKLQFTPLEISNNYFNEVKEELIEFNPEIKKKSNSEIISKKIISKIPINIKKVKTNKALSKFIKQDNDNNIVIDNNLSFYGSNSKNTGVISEMKSKDIYNIINENINENNIQFHKRKLTSINDEKLLFDKNSNGNKLYNSKDQNDNNENKDVIIHMKKKFLTNKPKKSFCFSNLKFNQDEVNSLSNIEEITNFYSYTEKCFEMMFYLEKEKIINKCTPLNFPFDKIINEKKKKLVIFDLDETLVHCQVKNIEECQYQIDINLPSKKKQKSELI